MSYEIMASIARNRVAETINHAVRVATNTLALEIEGAGFVAEYRLKNIRYVYRNRSDSIRYRLDLASYKAKRGS
jgi:hypothetical protein